MKENMERPKRFLVIMVLMVLNCFLVVSSCSKQEEEEKTVEEIEKDFIYEPVDYLAQKNTQEENQTKVQESEDSISQSNQSNIQEDDSNSKENITEESTFFDVEIPKRDIDWEALKAENEDIYAWIEVPETKVDYPILQHPTDGSYYLKHNVDHSQGYPGCIYTQYCNQKDFSDPLTVVYGHNMKNKTMFGSMHQFEEKAFFEEQHYIYIYTPEKTLVYEVFATLGFSDVHLINDFDLEDSESRNAFLDGLRNYGGDYNYNKQEIKVDSSNHVLAISTCIPNEKKNRYIILAVLINDSF